MKPVIGRYIHSAFFWSVLVALVMAAAGYVLQRFSFAQLEENYIFLYDGAYVRSVAATAGGPAQLLASLLTQFMGCLAVGPLVAGLIYGLITWLLLDTGRRYGAVPFAGALALLPSLCLFICIENNSYKFQGHTAVLIAVAMVWAWQLLPRRMSALLRTIAGMAATGLCYWLAGSVALVFAVCIAITDIAGRRPRRFASLCYPLAFCLAARMAYSLGMVPTELRALTPCMYYEWETTYFMMMYAWISTVLAVGCMCLVRFGAGRASWAVAAVAVQVGLAANFWSASHSVSVSRVQQQRYYARRGDWDAILAMDYTGESNRFTSYRLLALAHKGELVSRVRELRPSIDYFMRNQALKKKEDLQVVSDIYYDCDFMGGARHYAFDTDIVTPGAFNPYETLKLAKINIAYGDYAVAAKLLGRLEKTLFYAAEARRLRALLYDDAAVLADPELGPKRLAIPPDNDYMSPQGTARDLRYITRVNPSQTVAAQFYETFAILTGIK